MDKKTILQKIINVFPYLIENALSIHFRSWSEFKEVIVVVPFFNDIIYYCFSEKFIFRKDVNLRAEKALIDDIITIYLVVEFN